MTLQDSYLTEVAKSLNNETAEFPMWLGVSNQGGSVSLLSDSLTNEIGSRGPVNRTRTNKKITYNGTRSAVNVVDVSNGDTLREIGYFVSETGSDLQLFIDLAPVTQTTDFDVEVSFVVNVDREA
jgi:hypothetical protein